MKIKGFEDTIRWYNQNAKKYAKALQGREAPDQIAEFVSNLPSNARVLDAGCAAGRDSKLLKDSGVNPTGIDLSSSLIKLARKKHPNIDFIEGNFLNLPFEANSFDGIWANAAVLHFETVDDVKSALAEFNRVLKKNGVLHIVVKAQTGKEKTAVVSDAVSKHDRFFRYFTQKELQNLLSEADFESFKVEQYNEADKFPKGRPEIECIVSLSRKV